VGKETSRRIIEEAIASPEQGPGTALAGDYRSLLGEPVRLNLGCGKKLWPGFTNCDFPGNWSGEKPDVECDIRKLPFPDNYADEIHAIHVIEHFYRNEVGGILQEWLRVLKPGGKIALECPCLDKIRIHLNSNERSEHWFRMTLFGLYGEYWTGHEAMLHKWCYSASELLNLLTKAGFKGPTLYHPQFHQPDRDMRVVARK
jgi:predicted SAM-dependent methyltransferase